MSEVLERTLDPRITPRRILLRHPPDQLTDFRENTATSHALPGVGPFPRDELPVPAEQRVRRDDRRDLAQRLPTQPVGSRGKFPPVVIGQPQPPPTQLPPQDPILLHQVRHHLPLPAVQPASDSKQQHVEGRDVDHVRELTSQPRSGVATRSAEPWHTTGKLHLRWRNDNDFSLRYEDVVKGLAKLPDETVIDGEVIALD